MFKLPLAKYFAISGVIAFATIAFLAWRLDAANKLIADIVAVTKDEMGLEKLNRKDVPRVIKSLGMEKRVAVAERDSARVILRTQSDAVMALKLEGDEARKTAAALRERNRQLLAERRRLIAEAEQAGSRRERLSVEEELAQCERELDAIRMSGF